MRDYQCIRNNPYKMPHDLFKQVIYIIKDYDRIKTQRLEILHSSPVSDGQPYQRNNSSPTENKGIKLAMLEERCEAVEQTINYMNGKYAITCTREPFDPLEAFIKREMFDYFRSKPGKDTAPSSKTWQRYRNEFAYHVANKLQLI